MTEFIARGKRVDNGKWVNGFYSPVNFPRFGNMGHFINEGGFKAIEIDIETVCYKCPDTPYFEHDVLKVTETQYEENETYIVEVYFSQGAFVVDIEYGDSACLSVAELEDLGFSAEVIGNTIDDKELIQNP